MQYLVVGCNFLYPLWSYPVTEATDLTPCDLKKILQEASKLKNRPKKRVIPEPVGRV